MNGFQRRADIDGLRALAILSVMAFHFNAAWLPGGFAGVDVFFVISAYLITRIITSAINDGTFTFTGFYARRVKRIFPAAFLVFLVSVLAASQLNSMLLPAAKFVLLSLFNHFTSDYFTQDTQQNFFLHYWSLSIEEQFYFIWPALLVAGSWVAGRWLAPTQRTRALMVGCMVIGVLCFALGEYWVRDAGQQAGVYFFSIPRFGEMALGAFIALAPTSKVQARSRLEVLSLLGGLLLGCSFLWLAEQPYPGLHALAPCLGTLLLIRYGRTTDGELSTIARVLAWRPLVGIGLISYSLYLWHWPVLAIARFVEGDNDLSMGMMACLLVLIVALSVLTYLGVERPLIRSRLGFKAAFTGFAGLSMGSFALIVAMTGLEALNLPPIMGERYTNLTVNGQNIHMTEGWVAPCWEVNDLDPSKAAVDERCHIGAHSSEQVLMVGDSHGAALGGFIDTLAKAEGFSVTAYEVGGCQVAEWGMAKRVPAIVLTDERRAKCAAMLDFIEQNHARYKAIFVVNAFNLFAGAYDVLKKVDGVPVDLNEERLHRFAAKTPLYFFHDAPVLDRSMQHSPLLSRLGLRLGAAPVEHGAQGNLQVKAMVARIANAHWVDLAAAYQVLQDSSFLHDGLPAYADTNHLSGRGALALAGVFQAQGGCLLCTSVKAGKDGMALSGAAR
ncbi:acyltransferase family protein [Pseudomonas putida]|uniref:acyltransferase family protein n=1 Tax=Pseudomonas putida TaxID=303 RepID=UPI0029DE8850|nr:acyltransferase family protein [Pseudomonas putida]WPK02906.1 acyltransferase family protein [Pseudomonas putida]